MVISTAKTFLAFDITVYSLVCLKAHIYLWYLIFSNQFFKVFLSQVISNLYDDGLDFDLFLFFLKIVFICTCMKKCIHIL